MSLLQNLPVVRLNNFFRPISWTRLNFWKPATNSVSSAVKGKDTPIKCRHRSLSAPPYWVSHQQYNFLPKPNLFHQATQRISWVVEDSPILSACRHFASSVIQTRNLTKPTGKKALVIYQSEMKHRRYKNIKDFFRSKLKFLSKKRACETPKYKVPATKMSISADVGATKMGTLTLNHFFAPMEKQERVKPKKADSKLICQKHKSMCFAEPESDCPKGVKGKKVIFAKSIDLDKPVGLSRYYKKVCVKREWGECVTTRDVEQNKLTECVSSCEIEKIEPFKNCLPDPKPENQIPLVTIQELAAQVKQNMRDTSDSHCRNFNKSDKPKICDRTSFIRKPKICEPGGVGRASKIFCRKYSDLCTINNPCKQCRKIKEFEKKKEWSNYQMPESKPKATKSKSKLPVKAKSKSIKKSTGTSKKPSKSKKAPTSTCEKSSKSKKASTSTCEKSSKPKKASTSTCKKSSKPEKASTSICAKCSKPEKASTSTSKPENASITICKKSSKPEKASTSICAKCSKPKKASTSTCKKSSKPEKASTSICAKCSKPEKASTSTSKPENASITICKKSSKPEKASTSICAKCSKPKKASTSASEKSGKPEEASISICKNCSKPKKASTSTSEKSSKPEKASTSTCEKSSKPKKASTSTCEKSSKPKKASTSTCEKSIKPKKASISTCEKSSKPVKVSTSTCEKSSKSEKASTSTCKKPSKSVWVKKGGAGSAYACEYKKKLREVQSRSMVRSAEFNSKQLCQKRSGKSNSHKRKVCQMSSTSQSAHFNSKQLCQKRSGKSKPQQRKVCQMSSTSKPRALYTAKRKFYTIVEVSSKYQCAQYSKSSTPPKSKRTTSGRRMSGCDDIRHDRTSCVSLACREAKERKLNKLSKTKPKLEDKKKIKITQQDPSELDQYKVKLTQQRPSNLEIIRSRGVSGDTSVPVPATPSLSCCDKHTLMMELDQCLKEKSECEPDVVEEEPAANKCTISVTSNNKLVFEPIRDAKPRTEIESEVIAKEPPSTKLTISVTPTDKLTIEPYLPKLRAQPSKESVKKKFVKSSSGSTQTEDLTLRNVCNRSCHIKPPKQPDQCCTPCKKFEVCRDKKELINKPIKCYKDTCGTKKSSCKLENQPREPCPPCTPPTEKNRAPCPKDPEPKPEPSYRRGRETNSLCVQGACGKQKKKKKPISKSEVNIPKKAEQPKVILESTKPKEKPRSKSEVIIPKKVEQPKASSGASKSESEVREETPCRCCKPHKGICKNVRKETKLSGQSLIQSNTDLNPGSGKRGAHTYWRVARALAKCADLSGTPKPDKSALNSRKPKKVFRPKLTEDLPEVEEMPKNFPQGLMSLIKSVCVAACSSFLKGKAKEAETEDTRNCPTVESPTPKTRHAIPLKKGDGRPEDEEWAFKRKKIE